METEDTSELQAFTEICDLLSLDMGLVSNCQVLWSHTINCQMPTCEVSTLTLKKEIFCFFLAIRFTSFKYIFPPFWQTSLQKLGCDPYKTILLEIWSHWSIHLPITTYNPHYWMVL
jgi:hypothetical protein